MDRTLVREAAIRNRVCIRPVVARVTHVETRETRLVAIPCGSTRERQCPPCADRARRLRMHQCREGWHLEDEPPEPPPSDDGDDQGDPADDAVDDGAGGAVGDEGSRRVRSTRRRDDVADLPRLPVENRTVGRVFEAPDGKRWRPSTFITLTLDSYGKVTSHGVPVDPDSYDYRRAALDAIHFAKLVDRFWQNLRRAVGWKVQYFATIEGQRRLAPHLHAAARGALPRKIVRQVAAATYEQVWWPPHETPVYVDQQPEWDPDHGGYVDPDTREPLPTWAQALDARDSDPDATPAHVVRFGKQPADVQGIVAGTPQADRAIGYLAKYLGKDLAGDYGDNQHLSAARVAHIDRLHHEVRWLPCTERCANWLRYGIQPKNPTEDLIPGACAGKAHWRENLGLGGRRVLVSRRWTGKTLTGHRADRAAVVRAALEAAGIDPDDHAELAGDTTNPDGTPRWQWDYVDSGDLSPIAYAQVIGDAITTRRRWQRQYDAATTRAGPSAA
jgi:hypothetical protein